MLSANSGPSEYMMSAGYFRGKRTLNPGPGWHAVLAHYSLRDTHSASHRVTRYPAPDHLTGSPPTEEDLCG